MNSPEQASVKKVKEDNVSKDCNGLVVVHVASYCIWPAMWQLCVLSLPDHFQYFDHGLVCRQFEN